MTEHDESPGVEVRPSLTPLHDTVIIGGGIAGLACARRLHNRQRSFLLVTEAVGGRIRSSSDSAVNLGAYYVRSDYSHVSQFVDLGRPIQREGTLHHDYDGSYTRWDHRLLLHLPQALRFLRLLREFRSHYETFKQNSVLMSQAQAIRADPLLWNLYHEPALQFIQRHRIDDLAHHYLAPIAHGTAFTSLHRLTAFDLLLLAMPAIMPIYEFTARFDLLLAGFEKTLLFDTVTAVTPADGRYSIQTRNSGNFAADHVVVATPIDVAAQLLDLGPVKHPVGAHTFLVRGNLRRPWAQAAINLFPEDYPTLAIARQAGGSTLFCSASELPDFARYFTTWEVVDHQHWNPAFHLDGDALLECEQGPGLYLIGDHNVFGLEDAYITGIHAANRILAAPEIATAVSPTYRTTGG